MIYKKIFTAFLLICIIIGCKKGNDPSMQPKLPDISGNWALIDAKFTTSPNSVEYNSANFQCLTSNILSISNQGTTKAYYTGSNSCFVTGVTSQQEGQLALGVPGQDTIYGTWANKAGGLVFKNTYSDGYILYTYAKVATVNGKLQLTLPDTVGASKNFIQVTTYVKQ